MRGTYVPSGNSASKIIKDRIRPTAPVLALSLLLRAGATSSSGAGERKDGLDQKLGAQLVRAEDRQWDSGHFSAEPDTDTDANRFTLAQFRAVAGMLPNHTKHEVRDALGEGSLLLTKLLRVVARST